MSELPAELNRLAATTGLDAAGAANAWAGTTNLELVGALNAKAGITDPAHMFELNGICNLLSEETSLLDAPGALTGTQSGVGAAVSDLLLESGFHILLEQGGGIILNVASHVLTETSNILTAESGDGILLEQS